MNPFMRMLGRRSGIVNQRFDQNDWADEFMTFAGNAYPIGQNGFMEGSKSEPIENDFGAYVSQAYKRSGVVFSVMQARSSIFCEATFKYQKIRNGRPGDLFGHPSLGLLENPWSNGFTADLLARAIAHVDLAGNHYAVTEGAGANERIRVLRPDWTDILLTAPPDEARKSDIAGYLFRPGGTMNSDLWEVFPIDGSKGTVIHWAPIIDPDAQYRGMSWLTPILEEIKSDKAIMKHKTAFFEHSANPSIAISFKETVSPENFKKLIYKFRGEHTGVDNAYKPLFLGGGADVKALNATQIDFSAVGGHGEARIASAGGVHPVLLGLAETAVRGTALNAGNFQAAKDMFADRTMRSLWRGLCQSYAPLMPDLKGARLWYDDRDIAFLRADRTAQAELGQTNATTMASLIQAGFTPKSAAAYIASGGDATVLVHTGLVSVQLFEPGAGTPDPNGTDDTAGKPNQGANKPDSGTPATAPDPDEDDEDEGSNKQ